MKIATFLFSMMVGLVVQYLAIPTSASQTNPIYGWTKNSPPRDIGPFPAGTQIIQYDKVIAEVTENNTVRFVNAPFPESLTAPIDVAWETDKRRGQRLMEGYVWEFVPVGSVTVKNDNTFTYVSARRNDSTVRTGDDAINTLIEDWVSANNESSLLKARQEKRGLEKQMERNLQRIDALLKIK